MLKFISSFLLFSLSVPSLAQENQYPCPDCREVRLFPQDYGNHAFNEAFLKAQATQTFPVFSVNAFVVNSQGQYATVNLSRIFTSSGLLIGFNPALSYQVPYPSPFVQIFVQDPWGTSTTYRVLAESRPLAVGGSDLVPIEPEPMPDPEPEQPAPVTPNKSPGGLDLLGGYDASANYFGGATIPYYDFRLMNE